MWASVELSSSVDNAKCFFVLGKRLKKTPEKKTGNKGKSLDIHLGI